MIPEMSDRFDGEPQVRAGKRDAESYRADISIFKSASVEPSVVIIVLVYVYSPEISRCLDSIGRIAYRNYSTVLVDNGSKNLPYLDLNSRYPNLIILRNDRNLGYAAGNNVGLGYALNTGADYAFLINDDAVLSAQSLGCLVAAGELEPRAAILGPMVYHYDEPGVIQSAGGLRTGDWRFYHRGANESDAGQYREKERVLWVTGCAMLVRTSDLARIGLMDERFFSYSEEVDWCLRATEAGFQVLFVPDAKVWHWGVRKDYQPSPLVTYLSARNELQLLAKHHAGIQAISLALLRHIRTIASWSLRPRWRSKRKNRNALAYALRDFALRRSGAPPFAVQETVSTTDSPVTPNKGRNRAS